MIATPKDYQEMLWQIQNQNFPTQAILLPRDEQIYNIDLNTRTVEAPAVLGTKNDHYAETIYFKMDRYFDNMDLTTTVGLVQYVNKNAKHDDGTKDEGHIWPIPFYDATTCVQLDPNDKDKILLPWSIEGFVTKAAGPVEFAFKFYLLDETGTNYIYNLNTKAATSKVVDSMNVITEENENFSMSADDIEKIINEMQALREVATNKVTWIDAF